LYSFGATAYIYIPLNLYPSKLGLHTTCLVLIGYFIWESYKLLDHKIDIIYNKRNVHFYKEPTSFTKSSEYTEWENDDNFLSLKVLDRRSSRVLE